MDVKVQKFFIHVFTDLFMHKQHFGPVDALAKSSRASAFISLTYGLLYVDIFAGTAEHARASASNITNTFINAKALHSSPPNHWRIFWPLGRATRWAPRPPRVKNRTTNKKKTLVFRRKTRNFYNFYYSGVPAHVLSMYT